MFEARIPIDPPVLTPFSRLFWYAVFETLAVIAMAMYAYQLSIVPFIDTRTGSRYTSFRRSLQKQRGGTGCRSVARRVCSIFSCDANLICIPGLLRLP
jgi:hypothetical protein